MNLTLRRLISAATSRICSSRPGADNVASTVGIIALSGAPADVGGERLGEEIDRGAEFRRSNRRSLGSTKWQMRLRTNGGPVDVGHPGVGFAQETVRVGQIARKYGRGETMWDGV